MKSIENEEEKKFQLLNLLQACYDGWIGGASLLYDAHAVSTNRRVLGMAWTRLISSRLGWTRFVSSDFWLCVGLEGGKVITNSR